LNKNVVIFRDVPSVYSKPPRQGDHVSAFAGLRCWNAGPSLKQILLQLWQN